MAIGLVLQTKHLSHQIWWLATNLVTLNPSPLKRGSNISQRVWLWLSGQSVFSKWRRAATHSINQSSARQEQELAVNTSVDAMLQIFTPETTRFPEKRVCWKLSFICRVLANSVCVRDPLPTVEITALHWCRLLTPALIVDFCKWFWHTGRCVFCVLVAVKVISSVCLRGNWECVCMKCLSLL